MSVYTDAFAAAAARAKPPAWDRTTFAFYRDKIANTLRVVEDRKRLRTLMRKAQRSPTAQSALAWAKAHGIEIIVDHTTNAGGYYNRATGVVAVSLAVMQRPRGHVDYYYDVEVLVHEIRHAWQDHHGMLPQHYDYKKADLGRSIIQQALYEADAYAHGQMANMECAPAKERHYWRAWRGDQGLPHKQWDDPHRFMRYAFKQWYAGNRATFYPSHQLKFQAAALKLTQRDHLGRPIAVKPPDYQTEMRPVIAPSNAGLDPWRREDIEKLGASFAGVNYLAGWRDDELWSRALSPSSAIAHFTDRGARVDPLALEVRKQQLSSRFSLKNQRKILTAVKKTAGKVAP